MRAKDIKMVASTKKSRAAADILLQYIRAGYSPANPKFPNNWKRKKLYRGKD
jgi:hypothetical protein